MKIDPRLIPTRASVAFSPSGNAFPPGQKDCFPSCMRLFQALLRDPGGPIGAGFSLPEMPSAFNRPPQLRISGVI
jgi:hypothetical protein